jgi:RNA polymerase sigma factor (sigma-70 family)
VHEDTRRAIEKRVRSYARWVRLAPSETDDLVQHTLAAMASLDDRGTLDRVEEPMWPAYAARIAQRHLWKQREHDDRARAAGRPGAVEPRGDHPPPDVLADYEERKQRYRLALETLDPTDRMIVVLRLSRGLSHAAVAETLAAGAGAEGTRLTEDAVRQRYARAIAAVRKQVGHD